MLAHPGTQYSFHLAAQLERLGMLSCFVTGFAVGNDNWYQRILPKRLRKQLLRRTVNIPQRKIFALALLEFVALRKVQKGMSPAKAFYTRNRLFQEQIPQRLIEAATIIIGFDTSSWMLIGRCKKAGKPFVLDASIAHPLSQQTIFEGLRQRYPGWSEQLPSKDSVMIALENLEMQSANSIVVASQFTKITYINNGISPEKIAVNGYGTDLKYFTSKWRKIDSIISTSTPTRFLFFSKISARKGFPWLCAVWEKFHRQYPNTVLIAAGYDQPPADFVLPAGIELTGFVHPNDRLSLFHSADVFVFPSFFEGFAQVIIEAMACGLPVITTTHTVGPEVIENGINGYCIEPGDDAALYNSLNYFMEQPTAIANMGRNARQAVEGLSWDAYGERWKEILEGVRSDA